MGNIKELFSRNIFIIPQEEQIQFTKVKLGFFGVGMGSVVSELAVRMGFSNIFIADGDIVQPSNLNRQNFTLENCGHKKVEALGDRLRLRLINPNINLDVHDEMLNQESLDEIIPKMDIIYNFIDWDSKDFLYCHRLCREHNKTEFFTFNLGFTSACLVLDKDSPSFEDYFNTSDTEEIKMKIVKLALSNLAPENELHEIFNRYTQYNKFIDYDPQVALASYMSAWLSIRITIDTLRGKKSILKFPNIYTLDLENCPLSLPLIEKKSA